jgi:hypothetical protein
VTTATLTAPTPHDAPGHERRARSPWQDGPDGLPHQVNLRVTLPAYDDERRAGEPLGAPTPSGPLALVLPLVFTAPAATVAPLLPSRPSDPGAGDRPSAGSSWTAPEPAASLPPAPTSKLAALAIIGIVEVLTSRRPARHLLGLAAPEVVARLDRRARLLSARAEPGRRPRLRRLRMSQPDAGSVEIAAVLALGERCKALALRMDWTGATWLITAVEGF